MVCLDSRVVLSLGLRVLRDGCHRVALMLVIIVSLWMVVCWMLVCVRVISQVAIACALMLTCLLLRRLCSILYVLIVVWTALLFARELLYVR